MNNTSIQPALRRPVLTACAAALLALCTAVPALAQTDWWKKGQDLMKDLGGETAAGSALSTGDMTAGLREALRVGTENVVGQLGQLDGFNGDPAIHIPLPESFEQVRSTLRSFGMSDSLDDLELRLNRAAEEATPRAKALFWEAIQDMSLDDAQGIFEGPDDAATRYFEGSMSPQLASEMRPIVDRTLAQVGAIRVYEQVMGQYRSVPFVPDVKADLSQHVVDRGMAGIFHYLALEEAAIRQDPARRTTELLKRVFGR